MGNESLKLNELMKIELKSIYIRADGDRQYEYVSKLHLECLTELGKHEWQDVLNANIYKLNGDGSTGICIELSDIDAIRLEKFSKVMSGQCSALEYEL